jgi:hypothetical protein
VVAFQDAQDALFHHSPVLFFLSVMPPILAVCAAKLFIGPAAGDFPSTIQATHRMSHVFNLVGHSAIIWGKSAQPFPHFQAS